mmetsp:Transcript_13398/g.2107  ORF Transcript_13398/g.2107 Transcript_13398/m.2107 type:complete len:223 (-) Transcript_13398:1055-1723(-)
MRVILQLTAQIPRLKDAIIYPNYLILWDISDYSTNFRIAVPYDTTPGLYTLEWTKTGDDYSANVVGDEIYTDIGYTTVRVVDEKSNITMSTLSQVGAPGRAFPIEFTPEYPTHINLSITPFIESGISNSGITFEPESLIFNTGETSKVLIIRASEQADLAKYNVRFELGGKDAEAYNPLSNVVLDLVGDSSLAPGIQEITYTPDRLFSTFTATVTKASTIFY